MKDLKNYTSIHWNKPQNWSTHSLLYLGSMYIQFLTNESRVAYPFIFNTKKSIHLILIPLSVLEKSFLVKYSQSWDTALSLLCWVWGIHRKRKRYSNWNVCLSYYLRICALRAFFWISLQVSNNIWTGGEKFIIFYHLLLISLDIIFTILWLWIKRVDTWILIFFHNREYGFGGAFGVSAILTPRVTILLILLYVHYLKNRWCLGFWLIQFFSVFWWLLDKCYIIFILQ